ncbi:MAG: hypothetical protein GVY15_04585 [Bacteroidetes bacterium]|jgi:hypothetical protein|nr:hypothetical protein [Bacteroidota bacterium]
MNADGMNADGMNADGMNADGMNADGMNADGTNADGMNGLARASNGQVVRLQGPHNPSPKQAVGYPLTVCSR